MRFAEQVAHLLVCDSPQNNRACGLCPACKLVNADTHPDLIRLAPEEDKNSISIDRVRSLSTALSLKPQYSKYRIILITPAHKLNRNAANALLKTLEEPGENNLFLLVTDHLEMLPATIRSRCQIMSIPTPSRHDAEIWLKPQLQIDNSQRLLEIAAGSPLKALKLASDETVKEYELVAALWLKLSKEQIDPITAASSVEKIELHSIIEWITRWVIELIRAQFNPCLSKSSEAGDSPLLKDLQVSLNLRQLFELLEQLFQAKKQLDSPINRQLMLEAIFVSWSNISKKLC